MKVASFHRFRAREQSLIELVARANHLLNESFCEQVKAHGLSPTEWRVLAALREREGVTMSELAELVLFKQPTLTKAIDRMERAQLVERRTPSEDRRRTQVYITEHGRQVADPLALRAGQHAAAVERMFGERASRELHAALSSLVARLAHAPQPASGDERLVAESAGE